MYQIHNDIILANQILVIQPVIQLYGLLKSFINPNKVGLFECSFSGEVKLTPLHISRGTNLKSI